MNRKLIRTIDCIETPRGMLIFWELMDGVVPIKTVVYGIDSRTRQYSIVSPLICTGQCLINTKNYPLIKAFKVKVTDSDGCSQESENLVPHRLTKEERLLSNYIKDRKEVQLKASPLGAYPCKLLLRRLDGIACDLCGNGVCSTTGTNLTSDACPICFGTGIRDPYVPFPDIEWMEGVAPADDQDNPQLAGANRLHKYKTFRSTCDIHIKIGDIIVTGIEVYRIIKHEVRAAVNNAPIDYLLTCQKLAPGDLRYEPLMELAKNE